MAGLANLYSREFFELVRQRLTPEGLFAQWIQSYEMDWETFSLLGRTFSTVFPDGILFKIGPVDYLLLGSAGGKGLNWQATRDKLVFAQRSSNVVFPGTDFLSHLVLTEDLGDLFGPGLLHTDNHPHLEFTAPLKLYSGSLNIDTRVAGRRYLSTQTLNARGAGNNSETLLDLVTFSASANVPMFTLLSWEHLNADQQSRYKQAVLGYCSRMLVPAYSIFNDSALKSCCADVQIKAIGSKMSRGRATVADHYNLGLALIAAGRWFEAENSFRTAISLDSRHEPAVFALGLLMAQNGKTAEAARLLSTAAALAPRKAAVHKFLGIVELRRGNLQTAMDHLKTALALVPEDEDVLSELAVAALQQGEHQQAVAYLTKAISLNPDKRSNQYLLEVAWKRIHAKTQEAVATP